MNDTFESIETIEDTSAATPTITEDTVSSPTTPITEDAYSAATTDTSQSTGSNQEAAGQTAIVTPASETPTSSETTTTETQTATDTTTTTETATTGESTGTSASTETTPSATAAGTVSGQTSEVINSLGGTSVQMTYNALTDICDKIKEICKTLGEQWSVVDKVTAKRDSVWTGNAADRYFEDFSKNVATAKQEEIDTNLSNYATKILELVEQNKATDKMISERDILEVNNLMPTISGNSVETDAHTTDDALNDSVHTNDNVNANSAETDAHTTDDALNDSVHANDNVNGNSTETDAHTTDDALNNSVHTNDNVNASSADVTASTVDTALNDSVGVNGNIGAATSVDSLVEETNSTSELEDIVTAYAQASSNN